MDRLAFHPGELTAQGAARTTERAERVRRGVVAPRVPSEALDFLEWQRLLVLGAADEQGRMWATSLVGPEGFLSAPDGDLVRVDVAVRSSDPLAGVLRSGVDVGTLVIDLVDRIRLRVNGRWRPLDAGGEIEVHQAFGNCPKYIQARAGWTSESTSAVPAVTRTSSLDARARELVAAADTFFVATSTGSTGSTGSAGSGADVSHRGGNPGFVSVHSSEELSWPDYVGNAMMMTAGNLAVNPRAGLLFPDWENGATLQLTGSAHVDFAATAAPERTGAGPGNGHRTVFRVEEAVWTENGFPARWAPPEYSRHNG